MCILVCHCFFSPCGHYFEGECSIVVCFTLVVRAYFLVVVHVIQLVNDFIVTYMNLVNQ
jgi:hypothetical protein